MKLWTAVLGLLALISKAYPNFYSVVFFLDKPCIVIFAEWCSNCSALYSALCDYSYQVVLLMALELSIIVYNGYGDIASCEPL